MEEKKMEKILTKICDAVITAAMKFLWTVLALWICCEAFGFQFSWFRAFAIHFSVYSFVFFFWRSSNVRGK